MIKFLQLHTFYQKYIKSFYKKNPGLVCEHAENQTHAALKDAYGAVHMFTPYLRHLGYSAHIIFGNCLYSQVKWLSEQNRTITASNNWLHDIVRLQIETIQPDVVYASDSITFDTRFLSTVNWKPRLVMGWRGATVPSHTDWSSFDLMLSHLKVFRDKAKQMGVRWTRSFAPGFPSFIHEAIMNEPVRYDVVFCGQYSALHRRRNALLRALAAEADKTRSFSLGLFLSTVDEDLPPLLKKYNRGEQWGLNMYRTLKSGKVVINAEADFAGGQAGNMRLFETTGVGSFMLTEYHDNINDYFISGKEIETFRTPDEMIDKIYHYLQKENVRVNIARMGQDRCLRDYTMEKRARELDTIIQSCLEKKRASWRNPKASLPTTAGRYFQQASQLLSMGSHNKALVVLSEAKALRSPYQGIDYLRALCFIKKQMPDMAREALKEELRYFPDNLKARQMLQPLISNPLQDRAEAFSDKVFREIVKLVQPYTMIGEQRLYSLYNLARTICIKNIPGDFVECGVAAGGSSALLGYTLKKFSRSPRFLYAFDSFEGLPSPTSDDTHQGFPADAMGWGAGTCAAPIESLQQICRTLGIEDFVIPVKGYFQETLRAAKKKIDQIALLHMDGDWYDSTRTILCNLYENVSSGGYIQIDDYGHWDGCKKAVHEFFANQRFPDLNRIDYSGVWFQKTDSIPTDIEKSAFPTSPLTGSNRVMPINTISTEQIIKDYKKYYGIDTAKLFNGVAEIKTYLCKETDYRFFYPLGIEGDASFYENLEKQPWYYMDWKWEHQAAGGFISPRQNVLEIGCAKGSFIEELTRRAMNCTGLELNQHAVEFTKSKQLSVYCQSIQEHAEKHQQEYDVLCAFQVLEHIPDVKSFMQSALQALKPNGKLILSVPNHDSFIGFDRWNLLDMPPHHMGLWNEACLKSLGRFFDVTLNVLVNEPLQRYHYTYYASLVKRTFQSDGFLQNVILGSAFNKPDNIKGHTVLAVFEKTPHKREHASRTMECSMNRMEKNVVEKVNGSDRYHQAVAHIKNKDMQESKKLLVEELMRCPDNEKARRLYQFIQTPYDKGMSLLAKSR